MDLYRCLAAQHATLVGEWLFSAAAFGDAAPDPDARLAGDLAERLIEESADPPAGGAAALIEAAAWVSGCGGPGGRTSRPTSTRWSTRWTGAMSGWSASARTFQQNTASFALARRLKARAPRLVTVFGGANFDGEMGLELVRAVDCVDFAVIGEGDVAFPRLLAALAAGTDLGGVPGVARRVGGRVVASPPRPTGAPARRPAAAGLRRVLRPGRGPGPAAARPAGGTSGCPFESARGCWWGAKHHCTFCGLNGSTMRFRASPASGCATSWPARRGGTAASASRPWTTSWTCAT